MPLTWACRWHARAAQSNSYATQVAGLTVTALAHGSFFAIGATVASGLVPKRHASRAIAIMFAGLTLAMVDAGGITHQLEQHGALSLETEDVENSFIQLGQTVIHVVQLQEQVEALEKSRNLSEQAYRAGSITLTDVLDADRQLLTARDELDANRADAARAAVGVFRALGGGWDPATPPAQQGQTAITSVDEPDPREPSS